MPSYDTEIHHLQDGAVFFCVDNRGISGDRFTIGKEYKLKRQYYSSYLVWLGTDEPDNHFIGNMEDMTSINTYTANKDKSNPKFCSFMPKVLLSEEELFWLKVAGRFVPDDVARIKKL